MSFTTSRTSFCRSTYPWVVISPRTKTVPVVVAVSQATREFGSWRRSSSRTASDTWSQSLSGCPSVTDSLVKSSRSLAMKLVVIGLGPRLPLYGVLGLGRGHRVDLHPHGRQLHLRDLLVEVGRDAVHVRLELLLQQIFHCQQLVGEGHVHDGGRVGLRGGVVEEAALREQEEALVRQSVLL